MSRHLEPVTDEKHEFHLPNQQRFGEAKLSRQAVTDWLAYKPIKNCEHLLNILHFYKALRVRCRKSTV